MVSPITSSSFALLALIIFSLLFTPSSSAGVTPADIPGICTVTTNPPFCNTYLKTILGTPPVTYKDLCQRNINTVLTNNGQTIKQILQLQQQRKDPADQQALDTCLQIYNTIQQQMVVALKSLVVPGGHPESQVLQSASISLRSAGNCQIAIQATTLPLKANNESSEDLTSILIQLAERL